MAQVLAHRGPDDQEFYLDPDHSMCGLAHRRLSIIDIEGGHQPLCNEDESIWITYNGECYNFQELRKNLIAAGHKFKTNSDTEVIVHLYEEYGLKASHQERPRDLFQTKIDCGTCVWPDQASTRFCSVFAAGPGEDAW